MDRPRLPRLCEDALTWCKLSASGWCSSIHQHLYGHGILPQTHIVRIPLQPVDSFILLRPRTEPPQLSSARPAAAPSPMQSPVSPSSVPGKAKDQTPKAAEPETKAKEQAAKPKEQAAKATEPAPKPKESESESKESTAKAKDLEAKSVEAAANVNQNDRDPSYADSLLSNPPSMDSAVEDASDPDEAPTTTSSLPDFPSFSKGTESSLSRESLSQ